VDVVVDTFSGITGLGWEQLAKKNRERIMAGMRICKGLLPVEDRTATLVARIEAHGAHPSGVSSQSTQ
jgi:hypothetical protein